MDRLVSFSLTSGFCRSVFLAQKRAKDNGKLSFLDTLGLGGHREHVFDLSSMART